MFNDKKAFQLLDSKLDEESLDLDVICVGGYVLANHGIRTTQDIDGFYESSATIEQVIREVGEDLGINPPDELWLNNSVGSMNAAPPDEICEIVFRGARLTVKVPPVDYIAGMKLSSGRTQDIYDVSEIVKMSGDTDPIRFAEKISKYGFSNIDNSLILEAFGQAYGMNWLEKYYTEHEEEILKMY